MLAVWATLAVAPFCTAAPAPDAKRVADVSPGPMRLPASKAQFIRFHFVSHPKPGEVVTASFQFNGSKPEARATACRIVFGADGRVALGSGESKSYCEISPKAAIVTGADGTIDATVPVAFARAGKYRLYVHTASEGWALVGDYELAAGVGLHIPIQLLGVTPTQAVLAFMPPADADSCQVQVTSTQSDSTWDYSKLVPDVDPDIFPGADNAGLHDPSSAPQNRGFDLADGTRAIVLGRRNAEYSPLTSRMHSRALQAATAHEAWINCGTAAGTIDFSTANIQPGISFSDPLPADPDRPGDYAYPTLSWTDRNEAVVDPQTGMLLRPVSLPSDSWLNQNFGDWNGSFGAPIPTSPRSLPANTVFLPASVPKYLLDWYHFEVSTYRLGWIPYDAFLTSFLPNGLTISCPQCSNTPVTVCLTADGVTCAVDRNVTADPAAMADPNTKQKGVLGITVNCTGECSFPASDARWTDNAPVLASWHPNYTPGAPNTVLPSFQFDTVKLRITEVTCTSSAVVSRAKDQYGSVLGAPFNPLWSKGTPLYIDSKLYTLNQLYDENSLLLNESCPSGARTLTADTFGLLVSSAAAPISRVSTGGWSARLSKALTSWDAAGDVQNYTNCSRQPVTVGDKKGWHCVLGNSAYWIAADGSASLPMGGTGIAYREDLNTVAYCPSAFWDDADPNNMFCLFRVPNSPGKTGVALMTFYGDHRGLETAQFTHPDAGTDTAYLPVCKTTSPPSPNNCWKVTPMNKTGAGTLFVIEDAIRDASPAAWNASAFPAASKTGNLISNVNAKLDDNHFLATTWISQNSYGFNAILEYSTPRGTVNVRAVIPSWTASPTAAAGSKSLRWSGIHNSSGVSWGPTKVGIYPSYFRGCCGPGQGFYISNVVSSASSGCPSGASGGPCLALTVDGQPGVPSPSAGEPTNDAKTRRPGNGYLADFAPGDLMCAPLNNDFNSYCFGYIPNNNFEHLRVITTTTNDDGSVALVVQRNLGGTTTMPLKSGQKLFMLPSYCSWSGSLGCVEQVTVWDWSTNSVENVNTGGTSHQFTAYDAANKQVVNVTGASYDVQDPLCFASTYYGYSECYSIFGGKVDSTKTINSQLSTLFSGKISLNPPFGGGTKTQGYTGVGVGNDVDAHPGAQQMAAAPNSEKTWYVDGRPFNGSTNVITPPVEVAPDVYRFVAYADGGPISILDKYKRLPMLASCGMNALREVTRISTQTPYSYCVAASSNDCMGGSGPGDAYISCPVVKPSAKSSNICPYAGFGNYTPEVRDTCLFLTSAYAMGLTQTGFASQNNGTWTLLPTDRRMRSGRLLTRGFARYRVIDQYLNPKTTPDGGVLLMRVLFAGGYASRFVMAKLPPFPDVTQDPLDRRAFVATPATIDQAPSGATSVKVQFGYDSNFHCLTRPEACEARAELDTTGTVTPYYFSSEGGPAGLVCRGGSCPSTINLPGVSQRVIFYRAVYQVNGTEVAGPTRVTVVPDPVPVAGNN